MAGLGGSPPTPVSIEGITTTKGLEQRLAQLMSGGKSGSGARRRRTHRTNSRGRLHLLSSRANTKNHVSTCRGGTVQRCANGRRASAWPNGTRGSGDRMRLDGICHGDGRKVDRHWKVRPSGWVNKWGGHDKRWQAITTPTWGQRLEWLAERVHLARKSARSKIAAEILAFTSPLSTLYRAGRLEGRERHSRRERR